MVLSKYITLISTFHLSAFQQIVNHFKVLYDHMDPITSIKNENTNFSNIHFYFAISFQLFIIFYGTFIFHYQAMGNFHWSDWNSSPYIWTHQINPRVIWHELDMGFLMDYYASGGTYLAWLFTSKINKKFQIYVNEKDGIVIIDNKSKSLCLGFQDFS